MRHSLKTTELQHLVGRLQAGDQAAADELIRRPAERLEVLASRMMRRFPSVGRWEQTGDVLQNALQRLLRTLQSVQPDSVAGYFRLAAQAVHRELIDLARHYTGRFGLAANQESLPDKSSPTAPQARLAAKEDVRNLEQWAAFHEAVAQLPAPDRELIELGYYQGLKKDEIAQLLGVDVRTVRRRWQHVARRLADRLGDEIPS